MDKSKITNGHREYSNSNRITISTHQTTTTTINMATKVLFEVTQLLDPSHTGLIHVGSVHVSAEHDERQIFFTERGVTEVDWVFYKGHTCEVIAEITSEHDTLFHENRFIMYGTEEYYGDVVQAYNAYKKLNPSKKFRTWAIDAGMIEPVTRRGEKKEASKPEGKEQEVTDAELLTKLLAYSSEYEIAGHFWPTQTVIYIAKDGVDLQDYGGNFKFAVGSAIEYLERITGKTQSK